MLVPEASVHEDREMAAFVRNVRRAREPLNVDAEPMPEPMKQRSSGTLGDGVTAPYSGHDFRFRERSRRNFLCFSIRHGAGTITVLRRAPIDCAWALARARMRRMLS